MKNHAAGFLICKIFPDGSARFLGLIADKDIRKSRSGTYDIPKGKFEKGESNIDCAIRECWEESGILVAKDEIIGYPSIRNGLVIYSAFTKDEPKIRENPASGITEHEGFSWLGEQDIIDNCLEYLRDSIVESINNIKIHASLK